MNSTPPIRAYLVAAVVSLTAMLPSMALPLVQEWFVPQPEAQLRQDYLILAPNTNNRAETVIAITVPINGTKIVYDHWEDGYETDLSNPLQSSTRIWGDGNNANGVAPGYVNDPASFATGSVIIMRNQVPLPRNASNVLFDGRDRLGSTNAIVMTRAAWFTTPGPLLANSVEVRATNDWGTSYVLPVGEDIVFPSPATDSMFEHCSLYIMAANHGTAVTVDPDGNGPAASSVVHLNRGESHLIASGIKAGATIESTKPVQVMQFYGDVLGNYESRGANIPPISKWSSDYYAPVGSANNGNETYVYLYNREDTPMTIQFTTRFASGSLSIPAKSSHQFLMPVNSAARFFQADDRPFWGVGLVGSRPTANNIHDWGYSLVPQDFLSTEIVVGWGAGSRDGSQNGNPVWVTAADDTRIYIDYQGDRTGPLTAPNGQQYDAHVDVAALSVTRIFEPDNDQTGMRVFSLDGTVLTAAWGQDPATAGVAEPFLDLGNTTPNLPVPVIDKTAAVVTDVVPLGMSIGDTVEYTVTLDNKSLFSLSAVSLLDQLPSGMNYVANSTTRDTTPVADSGATPFPMDESGLSVPMLQSRATTVIKYRVLVSSAGTKTNIVTAVGYPGVEARNTVVVPPALGTNQCALLLTDDLGAEINYEAGSNIYVTVSDVDSNLNPALAETILATVSNQNNGDAEVVQLTETGVNTGIFRNTTALSSSTSAGLNPGDNILHVQVGHTIQGMHVDAVYNDSCPDSATILAPNLQKQLYLRSDGVDGDTTGSLNRISPTLAMPTDTSTSATSTLDAPVFAAISANNTTFFQSSGVTMSFNYGNNTGTNRLMVATVSVGTTSTFAGFAPTIQSITFAGRAMELAGTQYTGEGVRSYIYTLKNDPANSYTMPNTGQVVINVSNVDSRVLVGMTTFTGVNQTQPFSGVASNFNTSSRNIFVDVQSQPGEVVLATAALDEGSASQGITTTTTDGQVQLWSSGNINYVSGAASRKPGAAGLVRSTFTATDAQDWAALAISVKPVVNTAGGAVTFTQSPAFADSFEVSGAPQVTAHYTVQSGSMPFMPLVSAQLRKNGVTFATSNAVTASASTGSGSFFFQFPTLTTPVSFAAGDVFSLVVTNAQAGVTFHVQYDSSTSPSLVNLPTTTVILNESLEVYDAPYPGGNLVGQPTPGQTVYIRSQVKDPFGAYDITSLPLVIQSPDGLSDLSVVLTDSHVVSTTTSSKIYEYQWDVGLTSGNYVITATGKEGWENTIASTRQKTVTVSALDLGTPSITEFTTGLNGPHTLIYAPNETVFVRVKDIDQNSNPLVSETLTVTVLGSAGDQETLTLTETGPNTGIFVGSVPASSTTVGSSGNGTLHALMGAVLFVQYTDPNDPTDQGNDSAVIPLNAPSIAVDKILLAPADGSIVVGETAQFLIRVTNNGNSVLNSVQLSDQFPLSQIHYAGATPAPDVIGSGSVSWTSIGSLAIGASRDFLVSFTGASSAQPATNVALATAAGGLTASDSATVVVNQPGVQVVKTLSAPLAGPVAIGDLVEFDLVVTNTGSTQLAEVPLEDQFSSGLYEFVSASITPDGVGAGSLLWNDLSGAGMLAPNDSVTISVVLRVKGAATFAVNTAAVLDAIDENGDAAPPSSSQAGIETSAASISGTVFEDLGAGGFGGDVGLAGVTVRLFTDPNGDGDPTDGILVDLTTTDGSGQYEFLNLPLGNYVIQQQDLSGYASVADIQGANDNRIAVPVTQLISYPGNHFLDVVVLPQDFGSISGQVRHDTDADGSMLDSDSGLAGATLVLFTDPNGDGNPADGLPFGLPITTTSTGLYSFSSVPPGNYVVLSINPSGFVSTADVSGPNDDRIPVTVGTAQHVTGRDFLDTNNISQLASVGDRVWLDLNNNGLQDLGEPGISGVRVYLDGNTNGVLDLGEPFADTDGSGNYLLSNLVAGTYAVTIQSSTLPVNHFSTYDFDGVLTPHVASVTLSAGQNRTDADFGYAPVNDATIFGKVYLDANANGQWDLGESGVADLSVLITHSFGGVFTVTTNAQGDWTAAVPAGSTSVQLDSGDAEYPTGYLRSEGTDPTTVLAVAATSTHAGNDGFYLGGSISGTTQVDRNYDDVGDLAVPNVTYRLLHAGTMTPVINPNVPGSVPYVIVSANGAYLFENLAPGDYVVELDQPSGFLMQRDWDSTTDQVGSPEDPENTSRVDRQIPVALAASEHDSGNDFVLYRCATLFDSWMIVNPTAGGTAGNPDGDLYSNLLEYSFCMSPNNGARAAYCIVPTTGGNYDIVFHRVAGGPQDLSYVLRYTNSLSTPAGSWTEVDITTLGANLVITPDPSGLSEQVRITNVNNLVPPGSARGFYQFAIKLDYDDDGNVDVIDYTYVEGWQQVEIEANECETYSVPFLPCPQWTGVVTSMSGLTINLSGSAPSTDFTPGAGTLEVAPAKYRIEVLSGPLSGHRFDVATGGMETLVLDTDTNVLTGEPYSSLSTSTPNLEVSLSGAQIMLVKYLTVGEAVPISSMNATTDPATADRVLYTDGVAGWRTYWANSSGGSPRWSLIGQGLTDRGTDPVAAHQGLFVHSRSGAKVLRRHGMVRQSSFVQPIGTTSPMLGLPYPMNLSPNGMGYLPANFTGTRSAPSSDQLLQWTRDGFALNDLDGYSGYWLNRNGASQKWARISDTSLTSQDMNAFLSAGRAFWFTARNARPAHVVPAPWSSATRTVLGTAP